MSYDMNNFKRRKIHHFLAKSIITQILHKNNYINKTYYYNYNSNN